MVNQTTNPVICKTLNYKEEVYAKFAKEVVASAASDRKKLQDFLIIFQTKTRYKILIWCYKRQGGWQKT